MEAAGREAAGREAAGREAAGREAAGREAAGKKAGGAARAASPPVKRSVGIILCRKSPRTGAYEVLLVHKRYTYAFSEFVHGQHGQGGAQRPGARPLSALLSEMTVEEKLDVYSLNFAQMWYRIWLDGNPELYQKKFSRFHASFIRNDNGARLRAAVMQARGHGQLLHEPPKGRPTAASETDLTCAIRELREEAGVSKTEYTILPGVCTVDSRVSDGVRYNCRYFVAVGGPFLSDAAHPASDPRRPLRPLLHMTETSGCGWYGVEQIRLLDPSGRLEKVVKPAISIVRRHLNGRWPASLGAPAPVRRLVAQDAEPAPPHY